MIFFETCVCVAQRGVGGGGGGGAIVKDVFHFLPCRKLVCLLRAHCPL